MERTKTAGNRPPQFTDDGERVMYCDTELHQLLVQKMPQFARRGRIIVAHLAKAMGYSTYAIYRTLQQNRLSPRAVNEILEIAQKVDTKGEDRLTKDELLKFLLN